jgi:hypothetical protein
MFEKTSSKFYSQFLVRFGQQCEDKIAQMLKFRPIWPIYIQVLHRSEPIQLFLWHNIEKNLSDKFNSNVRLQILQITNYTLRTIPNMPRS